MELVAKLQCPRCQTLLNVFETTSGGRTIAVTSLGAAVERNAIALEVFLPPDAGPHVRCPACQRPFDPSEPYRAIPPLRRPR
jgi:hypothetical protein